MSLYILIEQFGEDATIRSYGDNLYELHNNCIVVYENEHNDFVQELEGDEVPGAQEFVSEWYRKNNIKEYEPEYRIDDMKLAKDYIERKLTEE